eukprot:9213202-Karenia_brevis.AAC.1
MRTSPTTSMTTLTHTARQAKQWHMHGARHSGKWQPCWMTLWLGGERWLARPIRPVPSGASMSNAEDL